MRTLCIVEIKLEACLLRSDKTDERQTVTVRIRALFLQLQRKEDKKEFSTDCRSVGDQMGLVSRKPASFQSRHP